MSRIPRFKFLSSLICCLLLCQAPLVSGEDAGSQVSPSGDLTDASAQNLKDVMSRLSAIEASDTLAPKEKALVTDLYQRAVDNLKVAEDHRSKARQYIEQMNSAPDRLHALQQELESVRSVMPVLDNVPLPVLEQQLLQEQSELLRLRNEQAELNSKTLAEQQNATSLLEEALQNQAAVLAQANHPLTAESLEVANAREVFELSEVSAANTRVDMLRQRLLSRNSRLQVLDRERQLLDRKIKAAGTIVTQLENALNEVRQADAEHKALETQQREARISSTNPESKAIAGESAVLAADLSTVAGRIDTLLKQLETLRRERARVDRYYSSMTQQLAISGADRLTELSVDLLAQRQQFSQNLPPAIDTRALDKELATAHMHQLKLEDRQYSLAAADPATVSALEQELLAEREQLIQDSVNTYRRYTSALMDVLSEHNGLQGQVNDYQNLLDSRLFWIPNVTPIQVNFFQALSAETQEFFSVTRWRPMLSPAHTGIMGWLTGLGLLLIAAGTFLWQSRLKRRLLQMGENIGKVNRDTLSKTAMALLISILLALPGPALLLALAAWVPQGPVEQGLLNTALLWFTLGLFFQICRKDGLAEVHFQWDSGWLKRVKNHAFWFILVLTAPAFLMPIASHLGEPYQVVSRLLFGAVAVALSLGVHTLLKPAVRLNNAQVPAVRAVISRQRRGLLYSVYLLFIVLPLLMLALSWMGYHFSAQAIQNRMVVTLGLLTLLLMVYALSVRTVSVLERRLKLERLKSQRLAEREQLANRRAADEAAVGVPEVLDVPEVDMVQVSQQSRAFVGWVAAVIGIYIFWSVWDNLLPALNVFDNMQLWSVTSDDPDIPTRTVTVFDFLLAVIVLVFSYLGVRNLPGVLEISVLRGMNLEPGGNYAITTIVKYVIVLVGVVAALNLIGLQWSKLQWLIAAIGVGLGFGLQEILANFVSGLLILFERPIRVGDTVTVGGYTGTVSKIRIRATTLTDGDRKEQIIPNKVFITEQLTNWTLSDPMIRRVIKVGVAYGSDVLLVHKLLADLLASNPRIVKDPPPSVYFVGFGASSLDFELTAFVPTLGDQMPLLHELHIAINKAFKEHSIEIPFPQQDVWIREDQRGDKGPE